MTVTRACPYCDEPISVNAIKCKHCGSSVTSGAAPYSSDPAAQIQQALSAKYDLIEEVGRGGMAIVYRAIQKNLDRVVALKVLPPQLTVDKEFLERFHREARSAARLHHPNIITIYDEGVENGAHYISMEFLEGMDLHHYVQQKGRISPEEAARLIAPIASALDFAHRSGVVHRDVKSSNIFIARGNRPVLTDFGIAHAMSGTQLTRAGTVLGTPEFMSPEHAVGGKIDGRSDIYSLGVVLYHVLTGQFPYQSDNPLTTIYKILHETHTPVRALVVIPGWLEVAVERSLEKDPVKRIPTGAVLAEMLGAQQGVRRSRDLFAFPFTHFTTLLSRIDRDRGILWGLSILAVILAAILFYIVLQPGSSRPDTTVAPTTSGPTSSKPEKRRVPSLIGFTRKDAERILAAENLRVGSLSYGSGMKKDVVMGQDPDPGAEVEPGSEVSLIVSE